MSNPITEDFVSLETAKLLKEKGFDIKCTHCFALDTNEIQNIYDDVIPGYELLRPQDWNHITEEELCQIGLSGWTNLSAPTLQTARKWLRKVHHYYIQIMLDRWFNGGHSGYYVLIQKTDSKFEIRLSDKVDKVFYNEPEEAVEAGIKYCLENLI